MMAVTFGFTWTTADASAVGKGMIGDQGKTQSQEQEYAKHQAIVMFKDGKVEMTSGKAKDALRRGTGAVKDIKVVDTWNFKEKANGKKAAAEIANVALVKSDSLSTEKLIKKLQAQDDVLYAEPNYKIHALDVDPYFGKQWSMQTTNVEAEWSTVSGTDEVVAVVDTGVDYTHEDLKGNMWENDHYPKLRGEHGFDFVYADDDPMDENGHGTHCAGIIGAVGNNGVGISGVNQNVKIMACRILDEDGSGYNSEEIAAYNYINIALDLGEPVRAINNSWGGGEYSDIFAKLIDIVGEKGAVSVFAAGNEANNNDEYEDYPSSIETDYSISVAATKKGGELVSFSNYGQNNVDVAAPGTDILSTVNYMCYNPGIYPDSQKEAVNNQYNGYDDYATGVIEQTEGNEWGIPNESDMSIPDGATYSAEIIEDGSFNGKALKISLKKMKADSYALISLPYTMTEDEITSEPHFSMMSQPVPAKDDWSALITLDVPADQEVNGDYVDENADYGYYLMEGKDFWDHYDMPCLDEENLETAAKERKIIVALYAESAGDYDLVLDDVGVSKENLGEDDFGKYDFMSGTSMAAPFITGAVALKAAELKQATGKTPDPISLISETVACSKEGTLPVVSGGEFDFANRPAELGPRISSARADVDNGKITLKGSGLNPSSPALKVEISYAGRDEYVEATGVVPGEDGRTATFDDNGWINNLVDIKITGYNGKIATKKNVYIVKGKKEFDKVDKVGDLSEGGKVMTDGKKIYAPSSSMNAIVSLDPKQMENGYESVINVDPSDLFATENEDPDLLYDLLFSRDMASVKGKLYTVVEYGPAVEEVEMVEFEWFFSETGKAVRKVTYDDYDDGEDYAANGVLYASELKLVEIDPAKGTCKDLGPLPDGLEKTMDWSLAAYNGKLFFIGGYTMAPKADKGLSKKVYTYDPAKKKWAEAADLPEGRAFGHVLQTGKNLVYTLGYGEGQIGKDEEQQECPVNLVFDGSSWTPSGESLAPFTIGDVFTRGDNDFVVFDGNVGVAKDGVVYVGTPVEDYGDTFTFNVKDGSYSDTGYNYATSYEGVEGLNATALGKKIYALTEKSAKTAPIDNGFVYIKYSKGKSGKHGKVTGVNRYYQPGDKAVIKVKANKKYQIKSFKVGTKKIKLKKKARTKTYTTPVLKKNLTVKVVFKKKK